VVCPRETSCSGWFCRGQRHSWQEFSEVRRCRNTGDFQTELATGFGFDFGSRKIELSGDGFGLVRDVMMAVFHFHLQEVALGYGGVEFGLPLGFSFGLEGFEIAQGLIKRALYSISCVFWDGR
jgi:hypothetical protein